MTRRPALPTLIEAVLLASPTPIFVLDARGVLAASNPAGEALNWAAVEVALAELSVDEPTLVVPGADAPSFLVSRSETRDGWLVIGLRPADPPPSRPEQEFVAEVTHDLRSPLTTASAYVGMLQDGAAGELEAGQTELVDRIDAALNRMVALINNLQDASRFDLEEGAYLVEMEPIDLNALVESAASAVHAQRRATTTEIELALDPSLPVILGDRLMLERAIWNLVDNAVKYSPPGREVRLETRAESDAVELAVSDRGYGIPAESMPLLFRRNSRVLRAETRHVTGTGLGLFIVNSIVQRHGGHITVDSAPGEGSTFTMILPVSPIPPGRGQRA